MKRKIDQDRRINVLHWYDVDYSYFPHSFEEIFVKNVEQFFEGDYKKRTLFQRLFPLAASVFFALLVLAYYLFNMNGTRYSPFTNTVSDLGNPILNPSGFGFFSAAFLYLAVIMIPFYQFVYKHLRVLNKFLATLAIVTNMVASGGFIALALFPNTSQTMAVHIPAAFASFGGMIVGGLFYYVIIILDAIRRKGTNRLLVAFGTIANVIIGIAATQVINLPSFTINNTAMMPTWEWTLFIAIAASALLFFHAMPEIAKKVAVYRILDGTQYRDSRENKARSANQLPEGEAYQDFH
ncbi:MAG TPA: DUF998 domain-containing protein [Candidatus Lokiarchaeia archaeon]|nr:DUF998 domain-containing protein [Candidatus Lokiarchaeia archaeon]